ncbi:MAG TPA: SGNH/GDSL hydrolase family protein [Urbifossiella sp.]|nr:SGNH/GDSL hydrolase family protein [Urbifossiella sp.]
MRRFAFPVLACAAIAMSTPAAEPALQKGEKIVFLGDSITQGGVGKKGYVTLIKNALNEKHKDLGITVIGAGISGNKVPDLQRRLEKDVLAKKPTLVVIYIGINDVWHGESDPARGTSPEKYEAGLKDIIGKIQGAGARVVLCTPTVIGEKKAGANKLDKKLDEYADISRKVAKETKSTLCDLRKAFEDYLAKHNDGDKERGILTTDRVHLNDAGNKLVAETILQTIDR